MGGEEAVAKQHERGRLTIRERIETLADAGSFREQGPLAGHPELDEAGELIVSREAQRTLREAQLVEARGVVPSRLVELVVKNRRIAVRARGGTIVPARLGEVASLTRSGCAPSAPTCR